MRPNDPARAVALMIADALLDWVGEPTSDDPSGNVEWVEMDGMACVRVTMVDRSYVLVEVNEGPA